jgi:hypothetical protein
MAMTWVERTARLRERTRAGAGTVRYQQPHDRRSRIPRWNNVVDTLPDCLYAHRT